MNASDFKELTKIFYGHVISKNLEAALAMLSDDVLVTNPMPVSVPFGGTYKGKDGMGKYFFEIVSSIEMGLEAKEFVAENDSVVVFGHEDSVVRSTGKRYRMDWVHHLRFTPAGLICGFHEYNPTATLVEAFQADRP